MAPTPRAHAARLMVAAVAAAFLTTAWQQLSMPSSRPPPARIWRWQRPSPIRPYPAAGEAGAIIFLCDSFFWIFIFTWGPRKQPHAKIAIFTDLLMQMGTAIRMQKNQI
jgi:hypothetical protein